MQSPAEHSDFASITLWHETPTVQTKLKGEMEHISQDPRYR